MSAPADSGPECVIEPKIRDHRMTAAIAAAGYESPMRRALTLAASGPANGINPQVGCVLVDADGKIVAEGWHRGAGTPHAEVQALAHLARASGGASASGLTAVVTLEPCNHLGLTGPCSEALIAAGIERVVYAVADPGEISRGGAQRLREAGIEVLPGVLEVEAAEAMRVWLTTTRLGRPFVTVKWASSLDGRAAAADGTSRWITGAKARVLVHDQRQQSDAILVGTGTVFSDDPELTARAADGTLLADQPIPVVVGERAIPAGARVFAHPRPAILTGSRDLPKILTDLYQRGIRHVFVEGGPALASAFVAADLVDRYLIYLAPVLLGGACLALTDIGVSGIGQARRLKIDSIETLDKDFLLIARPEPANPTQADQAVPTQKFAPKEN